MNTPSPLRRMIFVLAVGTAVAGLMATSAYAWSSRTGPHGGSVTTGPRGAVAEGPRGGTAAVRHPPTRPAYPARPVPVYPAHAYHPVGTAVVAGVAAGVTAGAIASASQPSTTTVVVASPPPAQTLVVGTTMTVLPTGCVATAPIGGISYYQCGTAWVQPYMQGSSVTYVVVTQR